MSVRPEAWPEVAYLPIVDAEPCTLAIVRRRDVADELMTPQLPSGAVGGRPW